MIDKSMVKYLVVPIAEGTEHRAVTLRQKNDVEWMLVDVITECEKVYPRIGQDGTVAVYSALISPHYERDIVLLTDVDDPLDTDASEAITTLNLACYILSDRDEVYDLYPETVGTFAVQGEDAEIEVDKMRIERWFL